MDSIIASPTNRVRVIVVAVSGCCASEANAVATARPSPSAGPILPRAIVSPAVTIDATAIIVMLSIVSPLVVVVHASMFCTTLWFGLAGSRGSRDVNRGQDTEDVGLHHAGQQSERTHGDREDEGRDGQQNGEYHRPAHHIAEQADGQGQGA